MARHIPQRDIRPALDAARTWIDTCLVENESLFSDGPLWTPQHVGDERRLFIENPDESDSDFATKLKGQVATGSPDAQKLMAEMLWALLLFPSNISPSTKLQKIDEIWALSHQGHLDKHPMLGHEILVGIGSGGTGYNTNRPRELEFLIVLTEDLKARPVAERRHLLTDYGAFNAWMRPFAHNSNKHYRNRQFRHMLRYLAFPDIVERMSSNRDRKSILSAFNIATKSEMERWSDEQLDRALLDLRQSLERKTPGEVFDFYTPDIKDKWSEDRKVRTPTGEVTVFIPTDDDDCEEQGAALVSTDPRESICVQAMLADIGSKMGFKVWIPRGDRSKVRDQMYEAGRSSLLDDLPLNYEKNTLDTIEAIDVLWLRGRAIVRAFEVEHTTAIYSGLLRMADLLALQPNMDIRLHIVAPDERKEKVFREVRRPVFTMWDRKPLMETCTFLSYDRVKEIRDLKHLADTNESIVARYEEQVTIQN